MLKSIGSLFVIFGLAAIVMGFMNKVPTVLEWVYKWGEGTAWAIKIGIVVVGAVLYVMGNKQKTAASTTGNTPNS
jgi:hypothetical protein